MHTSMALADGYRSVVKLPRHDVVFNTIGEADSCRLSLERATILLRASTAPVINDPARVLATGRADTAAAFAGIAGAIAPRTELLPRATIEAAALEQAGWTFPLLVRAPGFQEGRHFELVANAAELGAALARIPGDELFVIAFADTRGADGAFRKYRVLTIDGRFYPVHLAVSRDWKVHYFSADMTENAEHRAEEARFLGDVAVALGPRAFAALTEAAQRLDLDYGGFDFGLDAAGNVVIFEANATMAVYPPPAGDEWAYRRPAFEAVIGAVRAMMVERAART